MNNKLKLIGNKILSPIDLKEMNEEERKSRKKNHTYFSHLKNYYCERSYSDKLYRLQEKGKGNRKHESELTGYKTIQEAWESMFPNISHPRKYQIELNHGKNSFSYLYVIQDDGESQRQLEAKVKKAFSDDYKKQISSSLNWKPYHVRSTVKVRELQRGYAQTLRGGNHFSLQCR